MCCEMLSATTALLLSFRHGRRYGINLQSGGDKPMAIDVFVALMRDRLRLKSFRIGISCHTWEVASM